MVHHVPSDKTLPSLLLGAICGLTITIASYIRMTQNWSHQWSALYAYLHEVIHLPIWIIGGIGIVIYINIGWRTLQDERKLTTEERLAALKRNIAHLPARCANGWYKLCDSSQLAVGETKSILLMTKDAAIYRAAGDKKDGAGRGQVHILDAYCPHLGANMGHFGKVDGNNIECPFHGWQFDTAGRCTHIPYAEKIPATAKTGVWEARERNGSIWTWWHVDHESPQWELTDQEGLGDAATFHGRAVRMVQGNILEIVAKNADNWTGETTRWQHPHSSESTDSPTSTGRRWNGFNVTWSHDTLAAHETVWTLHPRSDSSTRTPPVATFRSRALLRFFALPVWLLGLCEFDVTLTHVGPSVIYQTFEFRSAAFLRRFLGRFVIEQTVRPENAFLNVVEWRVHSVRTERRLLGSLLNLVGRPIARAMAKLLLRLQVRHFEATVLPIYTPKRITLSLHNSGGAQTAFDKEEADDEEDDQLYEETGHHSTESAVRSRASNTKTRSATVGPASTSQSSQPQRRVKSYTSASTFATKFLNQFYSPSGPKRQEDLLW